MSTGNSLEVARSYAVCLKSIVAVQNRVLFSVDGCHEAQFQNKKKPHLELAIYIRNQKLFSKITPQNESKKKSRQSQIIKNGEIKVK